MSTTSLNNLDTFSMWMKLHNLIYSMSNEEFIQKSDLIVENFGGLRKMILTCFRSRYSSISYLKQKSLIQLLSSDSMDYPAENPIPSKNEEQSNINPMNKKHMLLGLSDDCFACVYKFLHLHEHIQLMNTCTIALYVGRMPSSFKSELMMRSLRIAPHFGQYMTDICANDIQINCRAIENLLKSVSKRSLNMTSIIYSGIEQPLMKFITADMDTNAQQHLFDMKVILKMQSLNLLVAIGTGGEITNNLAKNYKMFIILHNILHEAIYSKIYQQYSHSVIITALRMITHLLHHRRHDVSIAQKTGIHRILVENVQSWNDIQLRCMSLELIWMFNDCKQIEDNMNDNFDVNSEQYINSLLDICVNSIHFLTEYVDHGWRESVKLGMIVSKINENNIQNNRNHRRFQRHRFQNYSVQYVYSEHMDNIDINNDSKENIEVLETSKMIIHQFRKKYNGIHLVLNAEHRRIIDCITEILKYVNNSPFFNGGQKNLSFEALEIVLPLKSLVDAQLFISNRSQWYFMMYDVFCYCV